MFQNYRKYLRKYIFSHLKTNIFLVCVCVCVRVCVCIRINKYAVNNHQRNTSYLLDISFLSIHYHVRALIYLLCFFLSYM